MGQIVGGAAKPKRCNLNKLSQLGTPAAGEYILVSYDNSMTANGQGNFDRYIIGDGRTAAAALELKYLDDSTHPYIVEEVNKAVADIQPIEITGDVTNAPDEEDLTSENQGGTDVLKFKDKAYNAALYSGLGRVYLRKNIVTLEETGKNVLTQAMVNTANTIYHIQYDYDLNGQTITLPAGCVFEFDGGSVKNGTIAGNYTTIESSPIKIFNSDITLTGTWNIEKSFVEWFGECNADNFEKANSLATTHLLVGKFYVFDRQVNVTNSVIGEGKAPTMITGGAYTLKSSSTIIYIGDGGKTSVTPPAEAGDSILLIHNKNNIEVRNIYFVTSTAANVNESTLSVTSVFVENPKFSAIKMTTAGASLRGNIIYGCRFNSIPIGVNIYDLSEGTIYQNEVNSDNHNIDNCWFSNCGIGIQIYNTNAYDVVMNKNYFYGGSNTYRHINMLKGTFVSFEGYFGVLNKTTEDIKAAVYVEQSHYYTMVTPYAECHNGYFLYDNSNVTSQNQCNKALVNPIVKMAQSGSPVIDSHNVCVYIDGSNYNVLNIYGGAFTLSAYVNKGVLNLFGANILLGSYYNSANYAKVNKSFCPTGQYMFNGEVNPTAETSTLKIGGGSNSANCAFITYDNKNNKMQLGASGKFTIDAWYNGGSPWINFGALGIYLEPRSANSKQQPRTIGGFVRNSNINTNIFSLGVFDAWKKLRDVFGNKVGTLYEGTTALRPTDVHYGTCYFDTDLGKPIWYNGTGWVDATGTAVQ